MVQIGVLFSLSCDQCRVFRSRLNKVTRLKNFTAGLRSIAEVEGDLNIRLKIRYKDEIGGLRKWFSLFV